MASRDDAPSRDGALGAPLGARGPAFDLQPVSAAGRRFVELAEKHASAAAERSEEHDLAGTFPHETFAEMQASGFLAACLPEDFGGLGVESTQDLAAGFNRLARGDGSTALAAHMHTVTALGFARLVAASRKLGGTLPAWVDELVAAMGRGEVLLCVAGTEPGQTLGWFETVGEPTESGYVVRGRKSFASNSPAATHLYVMLRIPAPQSQWQNAVAVIERSAPGVTVRSDWDGMGMRASGSNSINFDGCFVAQDRIIPVGPPIKLTRYWIRFFVEGNVGLLASFVGVAEAAASLAVEHAKTRCSVTSGEPIAVRPGIQHHAGELDVRISAARAGVAHIARLTDEFYTEDARSPFPLSAHHRLMAAFQASKLTVNRAAIEAVDLAMTLSGGAGYRSGSPLSRLYRDVRAGPFMQAYSPNEAYTYIGRVALGLDPDAAFDDRRGRIGPMELTS